jgi:hypothetical protein
MTGGRLASRLDRKIWLAAASTQNDWRRQNWRRCFKIASETVTCSPKCRGIRRINVAIRRTFVYRPLYMYNVYHFHQSCRFFNELTVSGATGTSYWQWWLAQKISGEQRSSPKYQQSVVWSTLQSLRLFFFLLPPFPSSSMLHFIFHYITSHDLTRQYVANLPVSSDDAASSTLVSSECRGLTETIITCDTLKFTTCADNYQMHHTTHLTASILKRYQQSGGLTISCQVQLSQYKEV